MLIYANIYKQPWGLFRTLNKIKIMLNVFFFVVYDIDIGVT